MRRSAKHIHWLFPVGACLLQLLRTYAFYEYTFWDTHYQVVQAWQWWAGHGYSYPFPDPADLSSSLHIRQAYFPPGYAALFLPVYVWVQSALPSILVVHLVGIAAFFLLIQRIFRQFHPFFSSQAQKVTWAFLGLGFAPVAYAGSTDIWALNTLLAAFLLFHRYRRHLGWRSLGLVSLLLGLGALLRFAYYPFIAMPLLVLSFWKTARLRSALPVKNRIRLLGIAFVYALTWTGLLLALQHWLSQQGDYFSLLNQSAALKSWYPEHILATDPFVVKAFCFLQPEKLISATGFPPLLVHSGIWLFSLAILSYLVVGNWQGMNTLRQVVWAMLIIAAINLISLAGLSLLQPPEYWEGKMWTYLAESRYFLPVMLALILMVPATAFQKGRNWGIHLWARRIVLALLAYAVVHTGYRAYDVWGAHHLRQTRFSQAFVRMDRFQTFLRAWPYPGQAGLFVYGDSDHANVDPFMMLAITEGFQHISMDDFLQHSGHSTQPIWLLLAPEPREKEILAAHPTWGPLLEKATLFKDMLQEDVYLVLLTP